MLFLTMIYLSIDLFCITKLFLKFCLFVFLNIKMKGTDVNELDKCKVALKQPNQN